MKRVILSLAVVAAVLPTAILLTLAVAWLLAAMNDAAGAIWLRRIALLGGVLWGVGLTALLLTVSVDAVLDFDDDHQHDHAHGHAHDHHDEEHA